MYHALSVNLLTTFFLDGEKTFKINDDTKIVDVKVTRQVYHLSPEAKEDFTKIHDDWEINMCKKYNYDTLISGKSSSYTMHMNTLTNTKPLTIEYKRPQNLHYYRLTKMDEDHVLRYYISFNLKIPIIYNY